MVAQQLNRFGIILRRYRKAAGLTQAELAAEAGLGVRTISDYERGANRKLHKTTVQLLAAALKLSQEEGTTFEVASRVVGVPRASTSDTTRSLPVTLTSFVGRKDELASVQRTLRRDSVRLLVLTGVGGTGKTRLALEVARTMDDEFIDGMFFVSLAALTDPGLVASTIARAVGVREVRGQVLVELLKEYLRGREVLLILDSFEHLLGSALFVGDLLAACPALKILVTSRAVLHLSAEHGFPVPPLVLPNPGVLPDPEVLSRYDAVALFVERAQAADPSFTLTGENALAVAEICRRLDGLPLAIELAAARIRVFSPRTLIRQLSSRLRLLNEGPRDVPKRHQTLRNAIDWSYRLLDAEEQKLFARLSVFAGGCALDAADRVCNDGGDLVTGVLNTATSLIERSLLQQGQGVGDEPRFMMLETIREYAAERLEQIGERDYTRRQHALHYMAEAEDGESELKGPAQQNWLARLEQDHDNFRAALTWCVRNDTRTGLRLAGALWRFWYMHGHLSEGLRWLEEMLARAREHLPDMHRGAQAKALNGAGVLRWQQGEYERARGLLEESLEIRRELGNELDISASLSNLGNVACRQGDYERGKALFEESLALGRELGDTWDIACALNNLGKVADIQGDHERAATLFVESLILFRELEDQWDVGVSLNNLANLERRKENYEKARALLEESLALFRELGDTWGVAVSLMNLGSVIEQQGDHEKARALLEESLALFRELREKGNIAECFENLAKVAKALQQEKRATQLLGAASALRDAIVSPPEPDQLEDIEQSIVEAREALGDEEFISAWQEGRAMTAQQAIAYALYDDA